MSFLKPLSFLTFSTSTCNQLCTFLKILLYSRSMTPTFYVFPSLTYILPTTSTTKLSSFLLKIFNCITHLPFYIFTPFFIYSTENHTDQSIYVYYLNNYSMMSSVILLQLLKCNRIFPQPSHKIITP